MTAYSLLTHLFCCPRYGSKPERVSICEMGYDIANSCPTDIMLWLYTLRSPQGTFRFRQPLSVAIRGKANEKKKTQRCIGELLDHFEEGTLTRREFLRYAARLGISAAAASSLIDLPSFKNSGYCHADPVERNLVEIKNEILHIYQKQNLKIFWGDIHGHTGFSDGYGLP